MGEWICSICQEIIKGENEPELCDTCGADREMIFNSEEISESLEAVRDRARQRLKGICAAYPSCDGSFEKICQREAYGKPIGLGGAGQGHSFRANSQAQALADIRFNMSVIGDHFEPDTKCSFLVLE